jgi:transcriptional regulator with XRE-family HTH domain
MPTRKRSLQRRTPLQVSADRRAATLATTLGRAVRDARLEHGLRQVDVATRAAVAQSTESEMECGHGHDVSLLVWTRVAHACGTDLRAYLERTSSSARPRDAVHLRHQELVARLATAGSWRPMPEAQLDIDPARSRSADLLLERPGEVALVEIWDTFEDVGAAFRSWDRRLGRLIEREAGRPSPIGRGVHAAGVHLSGSHPNGALARPIGTAGRLDGSTTAGRLDGATTAGRLDGSKARPDETGEVRVAGCWVVRATRLNRQLVHEHETIFAARFPVSGRLWLTAMQHANAPMPERSGLLWISVVGDRLFPARLPGHSRGDLAGPRRL